MNKVTMLLATMLLIASTTFATGIQGEVVKIEENKITIELFGNETTIFETGVHVGLADIPKGTPTLDMLKG